MKVEVACSTVIGGRLQTGIPAVWQNPNGQTEYPFGKQTDDSAIGCHTICVRQNNLPRRAGVLIGVYPPRLKLDGKPLAPDLNFWPGGEVATSYGVWKRSGNCQGKRKNWPIDRYEIFLLFEKERLVLCDSAMRVGVVTIKQGEPALSTPTPAEMVDYITTVGLRSGTHQSLMWAVYNLEAIKRSHPQVRVSNRLKKLEVALSTTPGRLRARA